MGESNILPGEVVEATSGVAWVKTRVGTLTVPAHAAIGESVTLSIRPEQLVIGGTGEGALALGSGKVTETSFQGTHLRAHVAMGGEGGHELLLRAPATAGLADGDSRALGATGGHRDANRVNRVCRMDLMPPSCLWEFGFSSCFSNLRPAKSTVVSIY